jgi:hypothetical protein
MSFIQFNQEQYKYAKDVVNSTNEYQLNSKHLGGFIILLGSGSVERFCSFGLTLQIRKK